MVRALVLWADGGLGEVQRVLLLGHHRRQGDEVRNDRDDVDDVHHVSEEIEFVRTRQKTYRQFEREPDDTYSFNEKEWVRNIGHFVFFDLGAVSCGVEDFVVLEFRQRFEAEDDDGE